MIVKLMGGIGNQAWAYAFGRGVSTARQEPLMFTRNFFKLGPRDGLLRSFTYCLDAFNIPEFKVAQAEHPPIINDDTFGTYNEKVYSAPPGASYIGPWQTEKYFLNVEDQIRSEFVLREQPSGKSFDIANEIVQAGSRSMFLHVRRGDYLYGPNPEFHGSPSMEYYLKAVDQVRERCEGIRVFIFSDDPEWCKEAFYTDFSLGQWTVVDHNPPSSEDGKVQGKEHEDLWLMSLCQHAAIANSSFSFWGAWLGDKKKDRMVFAPKRWLGKNNPMKVGEDLIPQRWTKLESD